MAAGCRWRRWRRDVTGHQQIGLLGTLFPRKQGDCVSKSGVYQKHRTEICLTAVNADDSAEMFSDVPTAELAALEISAGVPTADLAALASELDPLRAAPGEELMRQGEPAS